MLYIVNPKVHSLFHIYNQLIIISGGYNLDNVADLELVKLYIPHSLMLCSKSNQSRLPISRCKSVVQPSMAELSFTPNCVGSAKLYTQLTSWFLDG